VKTQLHFRWPRKVEFGLNINNRRIVYGAMAIGGKPSKRKSGQNAKNETPAHEENGRQKGKIFRFRDKSIQRKPRWFPSIE
jgi:hypothetical protein